MMSMRQKVQKLNKYQLFNMFKFVDLMYLAQFYEQKTFLYKEYLYKRGQIPSQIYLIQEGDFQFNKMIQDTSEINNRNKLKEKAQKIKNRSKQKNLAYDFQQVSLYNVVKSPKMKQFKIGSVTGGIGQTIGQEEIICQLQKRIYNVKCISTNNKVIVIKRENFQKILLSNPQLQVFLKQKYKQKSKIVQKHHKNIQSTRSNLQTFVKILHKQKQLQRLQQSHSQQKTQISFKLPTLVNRINESQINKKRIKHKQNWSNTSNLKSQPDSFLLKKQKAQKKQNQKQRNQQDGSTFALTSFQPITMKNQNRQQRPNKLQIQNTNYEEEQFQVLDDSIPLKASKSWNNKEYSPTKILPKQKYLGMIDSSTLIKQKQYILSKRRDTSQINDRTQFEQKQINIYKQIQIQKQKNRQKNAAHSKQYMQKMLLNALKKAGYQQSISMLSPKKTKRQKYPTDEQHSTNNMEYQAKNEHQGTILSETKSLKRQRITNKLKRKKKQFFESPSQILESNPFDQCYFKKLK